MDNPNYTTEHRKGQHLLNEERYEICSVTIDVIPKGIEKSD